MEGKCINIRAYIYLPTNMEDKCINTRAYIYLPTNMEDKCINTRAYIYLPTNNFFKILLQIDNSNSLFFDLIDYVR